MPETKTTLPEVYKQAMAFLREGNLVEAERLYKVILSNDSNNIDVLYQLAVIEYRLGHHEQAVHQIDRTLAIKSDDVEALNFRGIALSALGRHQEALESYDKALLIEPKYAKAFYNRGISLSALNRHQEALASFDNALTIKPNHVEALNNRGISLGALNREQEALESFDKAVIIKTDYAEAYYNRGVVLSRLNRQQEALESFDKALANNPDYAEAFNNRGIALRKLNRLSEAIVSYEKSLAIRPNPVCHSNLIFALNFDPNASAARQQNERIRWNTLYAQPLARFIRPHRNDPDPNRRLRVGYVSAHFRHQASTYAFGGALLCHDKTSFEVVCYSDTLHEDGVTSRLKTHVHKWHNTVGISDDRFADMVRSDGIDILVDCVGHMGGHRLLVFARKPAPVQITAWGEPTGTGLKTMDHLFADRMLVPAAIRTLLTEQVIDLPNFLGYWRPDPLPNPGPLPATANGYITFGSFNRLAKIQNSVLCTWADILRRLPNARLIIKGDQIIGDTVQGAQILNIFRKEAIAPERVRVLAHGDRTDHFGAYQLVDIALDPFPHGGGMTTLDALWMGVPVVTWAGTTISSRLAAASLSALGLTDFIAPNPYGYVELAVAKANDLGALARLRDTLRTRVAGSPIGDSVSYTLAIEAAYRQIWQHWCARQQQGPAISGN